MPDTDHDEDLTSSSLDRRGRRVVGLVVGLNLVGLLTEVGGAA